MCFIQTVPTKAFDYAFVSLSPIDRSVILQAVEPSYSYSGIYLDGTKLKDRVIEKMNGLCRLDWSSIGGKVERNVLQVFVFFADLPANFDWAGAISSVNDKANVIVLDNTSL